MKRWLIAFASACLNSSASAFVLTSPTNKCTRSIERTHHTYNQFKARTVLYGTIQLNGKAQADLTATIPQTLFGDTVTSNDRTLTSFLLSPDSDAILLGMKGDGGVAQVVKLDSSPSTMSASTWECRQSSLDWFGLTLIPIFTMTLERSEDSDGTIIISIIDATTQVENGGKLGNALASAMRRSEFEGRNIVFWKEEDAHNYTLVGDIELKLTISLPAFLPLPPGFNKIGSRIIERTCRERLRQNLRDISNAYHEWATS